MANQTYRILVIDDLRTFTTDGLSSIMSSLGLNNFTPEVTYARNSAEAMEIFEDTGHNYFNAIFFDHDLGLLDGGEDTTYPCALALEELTYNDNPYEAEIFIHTSNSAGRERLVAALCAYNPVVLNANTVFYLENWAKNQVLGTLDVHQENGQIILSIKDELQR